MKKSTCINFLVIILITVTAFSFQSCKESKENKLEGTWKLQSYDYDASTQEAAATGIIWNLKENSLLYTSTNPAPDTMIIGTYDVSVQINGSFLEIEGVPGAGRYKVEKLNDQYLVLRLAKSWERKEFVKD